MFLCVGGHLWHGKHSKTNNGLILRKDLHTLFDRGYITVTKDLHIEVSKRIKEDYGNGKEYYAFQGKKLIVNLIKFMKSLRFSF